MTLPNLQVTLSRTSDGKYDYLQVVSDDQFALNIVLIADSIDVKDTRKSDKPTKRQKPHA